MRNRLRVLPSSSRGFSEWRVAPLRLRLGAQVVDQGLASLVVLFIMALWFPTRIGSSRWFFSVVLLWILISSLTQIWFSYFFDGSPGKKAMGLFIQSARPQGGSPSLVQHVVRTMTWWLGAISFGTGWSTALNRDDRRTWHDFAAETIVVSTSKKPDHPSVFEKRLSRIWLAVVSALFVIGILCLLAIEFRTLRKDQYGFQPLEQSSDLEKLSWLSLTGEPLPSTDALMFGDEARLRYFLKLFLEAKRLPFADRYKFYKEEMEDREDQLCRSGSSTSMFCQSAELMVELLAPQPTQNPFPLALRGLQELQKIESLSRMDDQIKMIESKIEDLPVFSLQTLAFKALEAKIFLRSGDFAQAERVVRDDVYRLARIKTRTWASGVPSFLEVACGTIALSKESFEKFPACGEISRWKSWNIEDGETLAYWWHVAKTSKTSYVDVTRWNEIQRNGFKSNFETDLSIALDFVINIRTKPKNVLTRERKLSMENPLWGWSHKQALQEFGPQWTYIVYPLERRMLEKFNILAVHQSRSVASVEKREKIPRLTPQLTIEY